MVPEPRGKKKKKRIIRGKMETVTEATQEPQNIFTLSDPKFLGKRVLGQFSSNPGETSHTESSMSN